MAIEKNGHKKGTPGIKTKLREYFKVQRNALDTFLFSFFYHEV